ncbi:MAG TPA: glycogen debranching N-terminal domain-containing protein [Micromonosporaceae bacterium]|nr:glycogen debranching N-terminal domain-containing protein [Micromonosporaceae bacterium]
MTDPLPSPRTDNSPVPDLEPSRQPYLHDRVLCLASPALWISAPSGQLTGGVDGLYVADRRVLSRLEVRVAGKAPEPISGGLVSASQARFVGVVRELGGPRPDPTVTCEREREVTPDGGTERITVHNRTRRRVRSELTVALAADLAVTGDVKQGRSAPELPPAATDGNPDEPTWRGPGISVWLECDPVPAHRPQPDTLVWPVDLAPGESFSVSLTVRASHSPAGSGFRPRPPVRSAPWRDEPLSVRAADRRLDELVRQSVMDLDALLLGDPADLEDSYFAAGAPWYLTLFGRDSLWTARMSLPLGAELAASTLRTLARRQGTRPDSRTGEAPGKIPHELRSSDAAVWLPETYYGTVDATPLFVATLADAWRWGMPEAEVAALLPAVERALDWLTVDGDPDSDGFIEYAADQAGLSNQGWKDSHDGVQWADGRLAEAPLALCEVQGYAYQAAMAGADLLDAFGRPGGERWRAWAADLAKRFREAFWVSDVAGPYPAVALDRDNKPVDSPTSNLGHLLGTGLLDATEEAEVARRLSDRSFDSGYGLRTLADTAKGFNPLSYHAGSVWPHDTAIAILGLVQGGWHAEASALIKGLLAAASRFAYRLPELYSGERRADPLPPVPYPASCRPQGWAAAAAPAIVRALLGLRVDVTTRRVRLSPITPSPVGEYEVTGLRLAGGRLDVRVDATGNPTVLRAPDGIVVTT